MHIFILDKEIIHYQEAQPEHPIEHIIIAYAATIQLRQDQFNLEELLFLQEAIMRAIDKQRREIH